MSKIINGFVVKLSPYEQRNFTNKHGVEIGKPKKGR
jgi:hypothetical protein